MDDNFTFFLFLLAPPIAGELLLLFVLFRVVRTFGTKFSRAQVLWLNLLSVVVLVVLGFLGGELYYRFIYDTTDSLAYTKVSQQWGRRYYMVNAAGFRDNIQYSTLRAPGKRRISFLGDSFTAGHGIKSVEDRFPNLIRAGHPEWEIHVLAKLGQDTGGELAEVQKYFREGYQFDVVVLVYCLNDVADLFPEWTAAITRINEDVAHAGWLRRHSYFYDILYHRYQAAHNPYVKDYYSFVRQGYTGEKWEQQKQRLRSLRDMVQASGGRFMVVTFPFLQSLDGHYEYLHAHEQLDHLWGQLGVPHLDLLNSFTNLFREKLTVNRYDAHPNEFANAIAAKAIERFLVAQLGTNSPTPTKP